MTTTADLAGMDLDAMLKRLHLPTVRRLYAELEEQAEAQEMGYRDYLALLMAEEIAHRAQTRIQRSVRKARFPFLGTIEDFDFTFQTSVRLGLLGSFLGPELVSEGRNLILSGPTGTGKTRLAVGIAYRAIQNGFEARFTTAVQLIEELSNAARSGRLTEALHDYLHPHVLVVDEVGYLTLRDNAANVLFQVVNERYLSRKPMVFTTNKPLAAWGVVLHDPDLAEALLDRVLERGRHLQLRGPSYRTRHHKQTEKTSPHTDHDPGARITGNVVPDFPEPTFVAHGVLELSWVGEPKMFSGSSFPHISFRPRRPEPTDPAGALHGQEIHGPVEALNLELQLAPERVH